MLAKRMKDESSYVHKQLSMHVSSFGITGNNPYTYNCDELYMASPLEKSTELVVLIIKQNKELSNVVLWLLLDNEQF